MSINSLANIGWQVFFQQQLSHEEWESSIPVRVVEQHKSSITALSEKGSLVFPVTPSMPELAVGDWLLLDGSQRFLKLLDRKTCFSRKAAGSKAKLQLISANVDTALIVCSMNDDFNLNRIERFLSLVNDSGAEPVVLLSKSDLVHDPEAKCAQVQKLDPMLMVEFIDCRDTRQIEKLSPWIKRGRTLAVLGSSGVGKSTLVNTLLGRELQRTNDIREDDAKGRHTTTSRSLISLSSGALILDTPGIREIQLADCKEGIASTFSDIEALADSCRFNDCQHEQEPGCAVCLAVERGDLELRRLNNYRKLKREEAINTSTLAERRASAKALGKYYKRTLVDANKLKGR